jgi:hypothetical protein
MQIFEKLHGFSISTVLCLSTTERKAECFSFAGDEHEGIEQNESFVGQGGGERVLASDAVR